MKSQPSRHTSAQKKMVTGPTGLLFLDVDGVLNSVRRGTETGHWGRPPDTHERLSIERLNWDPACVARVQSIVQTTDMAIVISSSWRLNMSVRTFRRAFALYGWVDAPVMGATPDVEIRDRLEPVRGREVAAWLAANGAVHLPYVCLDDVDDFLPGQPLVRTDWNVGVQDPDVERVLALFAEQRQLGRRI